MRNATWVGVALLVTVVAGATVSALDARSLAYKIPAGSELVLNEPLRVQAGEAAAYLRNGRQIDQYEGDKYLPVCRFRIKGDKAQPRVIEPDTFRITEARREYTIVQGPGGSRSGGLMRVGADPTYEIYGVHLELQSARQPAVWRLTCQELYGWGDFSAWHITLGRVRQALGDVAQIRIAE